MGSGCPFVLWGSCFWCVCMCVRAVLLLCPFYNAVGVVLLSFFRHIYDSLSKIVIT